MDKGEATRAATRVIEYMEIFVSYRWLLLSQTGFDQNEDSWASGDRDKKSPWERAQGARMQ